MKTIRYFNTEGCCLPAEHYMVPLDDRIKTIRELYIDRKKYFVINRGRQYGKTTMLVALAAALRTDFAVILMDFQLMSTTSFVEEPAFVTSFVTNLADLVAEDDDLADAIANEAYQKMTTLCEQQKLSMDEMFRCLSRICKAAKKPVILMIDEVDSASNNQVFIDFLAQLRGYYLARSRRPFFHSVILAGVYDIKNLKLKIRPNSEHQYNSPWNIAADFDVTMRFSSEQIQSMLNEYQTDHQTEMDIVQIANEIYQYTSGYPYLVSALCKIVDEILSGCKSVWTREYIVEAVKILLGSRTTL